tara:strand:- start:909 stop:1706 length:798 start_codon:yes stop_codon:yes gene_type:complete
MQFNKIGIMQGRLLSSPNKDDLDWFPFDYWHKEFEIARSLDFQTVEIVLDRAKSKNNPIWSPSERKKIKKTFKSNKLIPYSSCINFLIDYSIRDETIFNITNLAINYLQEIGIQKIILPLFKKSSLDIVDNQNAIKRLINTHQDSDYDLLIETDLSADHLLEILNKNAIDRNGIVYDIGNTSYLDHDIENDLNLLKENIKHIHIKDKNKYGKNVLLGEGVCDFDFFFSHPTIKTYNEFLVLETLRGDNPVETTLKNLEYIKNYLD